jgi:hypothetical protein
MGGPDQDYAGIGQRAPSGVQDPTFDDRLRLVPGQHREESAKQQETPEHGSAFRPWWPFSGFPRWP